MILINGFRSLFISSILVLVSLRLPICILEMATNSAQPTYSTELELTNAHLGLAYLALGDMVKRYPHLITTLHPVLLLELVRLGHLSSFVCQELLLTDYLNKPASQCPVSTQLKLPHLSCHSYSVPTVY
jgi:hypothetical protein